MKTVGEEDRKEADNQKRKEAGFADAPFETLDIARGIKWSGAYCQDKWVAEEVFKGMKGGYYVDIGANHPIIRNNTYILDEKFGWSGISIDADPQHKTKFPKMRSCPWVQACLDDKKGRKVEFLVTGGSSGIVDYYTKGHMKERVEKRRAEKDKSLVKYKTQVLADVLRKHKAPKLIHYLNIDVEGAEYAVLKNFPFDEFKVIAITLEHNNDPVLKKDLGQLLEHKGYVKVKSWGNSDEGFVLKGFRPLKRPELAQQLKKEEDGDKEYLLIEAGVFSNLLENSASMINRVLKDQKKALLKKEKIIATFNESYVHKKVYEKQKNALTERRQMVDRKNEYIAKQKREIERLRNSKSYRLGHTILRPVKSLRNQAKKLKFKNSGEDEV